MCSKTILYRGSLRCNYFSAFKFFIYTIFLVSQICAETYVRFDGVDQYGFVNVAVTSDVTIEAYVPLNSSYSVSYFCLNKPSLGCNNNYMVYSLLKDNDAQLITGARAHTPGASDVSGQLLTQDKIPLNTSEIIHVAWVNTGGGFST